MQLSSLIAAHNYQAFKLIVVKTHGNEENLKRIYDRKFFVQAPIVICACTLIEDTDGDVTMVKIMPK